MALHIRTQIRNAVKTALTGLTTTGNRVHATRMRPRTDAELPALSVRTDGEPAELYNSDDIAERPVRCVITAYVKSRTADDDIDRILKEIEAAMVAAGTFGDLIPSGAGVPQIADPEFDDLDRTAGEVEITYILTYYTTLGVADVALT